MNKDIDNINNTDESVEKALDIMESSSEINDEQLQEMLKDKDGHFYICDEPIEYDGINKIKPEIKI